MTPYLLGLASTLRSLSAVLMLTATAWAQQPAQCRHVVKSVVVTEVSIYRDWQGGEVTKWLASRIPPETKIDTCAPNGRYRITIAREVVWIDAFAVAIGADPAFSTPSGPALPLGTIRAEYHPTKPVTIIVTSAPGGTADIVARVLSEKLTQLWQQKVIVENRTGAGGAIGASWAAKAPSDGYTLLLASDSTLTILPALRPQTPFSASDFAPITGLAGIPYALVTSPALPAKNLKEFIDLTKRQSGKFTYGTAGTGSPSHLDMLMLQRETGVTMQQVPFAGSGQAINALMSGETQVMFAPLETVKPQADAGRINILAVGTPKRVAQIPDVPTIVENGYQSFDRVNWLGLFAPRGTPENIVSMINTDVRKIVEAGAFQENALASLYLQPFTNSPEEFSKYIQADTEKQLPIVRALGGIPN